MENIHDGVKVNLVTWTSWIQLRVSQSSVGIEEDFVYVGSIGQSAGSLLI